MSYRTLRSRAALLFVVVTGLSLAVPAHMDAQAARGAEQPATPLAPKAGAPVDLTAHWTSTATDDGRFRMITPDKVDVSSVPLNPAAHRRAYTGAPHTHGAGRNHST